MDTLPQSVTLAECLRYYAKLIFTGHIKEEAVGVFLGSKGERLVRRKAVIEQ